MGNINLLFENVGGHVSFNGKITDVQRYKDKLHDDGLWAGPIAYEVIRVIRGVPMFFEDHLARLNASMEKLGMLNNVSESVLLPMISGLLQANDVSDCNVKLWVASAPNTPEPGAAMPSPAAMNLFANINKSIYPPPGDYLSGVPVGIYQFTREDPNVKRVVAGYKEKVQGLMDAGGVTEVLLLDDSMLLLEGSRSNLFFSRGGKLFTAPGHIVLKGIIRRFIFAAANRAGIEIIEKPVNLGEAASSDGAFITGTPIGVLPVSAIRGGAQYLRGSKDKSLSGDIAANPTGGMAGCKTGDAADIGTGDITLNSAGDKLVRQIMSEYEKIAQEYIKANLQSK